MDAEQVYQDTLNYLYSFVDYSLTRGGFAQMAGKFELDRMHRFAAALGNPHYRYPILHVAGTKGKGSVSALCAAALQEAGYRVGLYTSPHLIDYTERIQVDGQPIARAELVALVDELRPMLDAGTQLTTFEITTGLALDYFARQGCTAVVLEVGLGGRLDATNIVTPLVSVITSLSLDHQAVLGDTLGQIAGEKAGIIKPGAPVVLAPQQEQARAVVARIAAERGSPLVQVGEAVHFRPGVHSLSRQSLLVWEEDGEPLELQIPLLGAHQVENAAVAYTALLTAGRAGAGLTVSQAAIQRGFARANWPGRFELLQSDPPVVIDSAHNRDSAHKLRQALDDYFPGRRVILVYGASEDKDIAGMFDELLPRVEQVIVTRSFHPRAADPQVLVEMAARYGRDVTIVSEVKDALDEALRRLDGDHLVLVTGSIFIAAGARETWYNQRP
ncbi:MAG: bifunctional folylpolyglutamate synthase/dihydrofolate synthase [Chloroflexota bacterium]